MSESTAPAPTAAPATETNSSTESTEAINSEAIAENAPFASDEELSAALEAEFSKEEVSEETSHEEEAEESAEEELNATDTSADEDQESVDEGKSDSKEVERRLREELLKKNRQIEDAQKFISRINQRYGDLKKQIVDQIAGIERGVDDMSPAQQTDAVLQLRELKGSLERITNEEALFNHTVKTKEAVERAIPEDEWNLDLMVEEMEAEGGDPEYIARFKQNPFAAAHPHEIIMLHKATRAKYGMRVLGTALKNAQKENAELRAKLKSRPSEIVKKIDNVSKNSVGVTAKSGGGGAKRTARDLSDAEISRLSEQELNELLAASLNSEG